MKCLNFIKPTIIISVFYLLLFQSCKPKSTDGNTENKSNINQSIENDYNLIKLRGTVKIGVQSDANPLNYVEDGKRLGLDYELAKLIFSQSEFSLTSEKAIDADHWVDEYDDIPKMLKEKGTNGEYNVDIIMGGLTFVDGDDPDVIYSIPYLEDFGYSLIAKKTDTYTSLKDLRNKKIGVVKGDPDVISYVKSVLPTGASIVELSDDSETWLSDFINGGQCSAIIYDYPFAAKEIEGSNLEIKVSKLNNSDISYKIGLRKGNEKLRNALNSAISKVKVLPSYSELLKKYLLSSNIAKVKNLDNNPTYTVKAGESLSLIAKAQLGDINKWKEIQDLNNIPNPHLISTGQVLILPK